MAGIRLIAAAQQRLWQSMCLFRLFPTLFPMYHAGSFINFQGHMIKGLIKRLSEKDEKEEQVSLMFKGRVGELLILMGHKCMLNELWPYSLKLAIKIPKRIYKQRTISYVGELNRRNLDLLIRCANSLITTAQILKLPSFGLFLNEEFSRILMQLRVPT